MNNKEDVNEAKKKLEDMFDIGSDTMKNSFKNLGEVFENIKIPQTVSVEEILNKERCTHCNNLITDTKYCEDCYQKIITENIQLQQKLDDTIPITQMKIFKDDIYKILTNGHLEDSEKVSELMLLFIKYTYNT